MALMVCCGQADSDMTCGEEVCLEETSESLTESADTSYTKWDIIKSTRMLKNVDGNTFDNKSIGLESDLN